MLLDVAQYEIGGNLRTFVKDIDRSALSQLTGVEDVGLSVLAKRRQNASSMDLSDQMPPILTTRSSRPKGGTHAIEGVEDLIVSAAPRIRIDPV